MPVDHISEYACVGEYQAIEQDYGITTHHVTFEDDLDHLYGQLLLAIAADGFKLAHVDIDGERHATFVEAEDMETYQEFAFQDIEDGPDAVSNWVNDRGERRPVP